MAAPKYDGGPNGTDKENGVKQSGFCANEFQKVRQRWLPGVAGPGIVGYVIERDPVPLGIPDQDRRHQQQVHQQCQVWARAAKMLAGRSVQPKENCPAQ